MSGHYEYIGVFSTPGDTISTTVDIMITSVRPSIDLHFKPWFLCDKNREPFDAFQEKTSL